MLLSIAKMKKTTVHVKTKLHIILFCLITLLAVNGSDCIAAIKSYHSSPGLSNPDIVPQNGIFELTLADKIDYGTQGNFFNVSISVAFTSASKITTTVYGFYYETLPSGTSLWKARFCPSETGTYTYSYNFIDPKNGNQSGNGSFQVVTGNNPGFIRENPSNKFRWEFSNGEPFYPIGYNGQGGFTDEKGTDGGDRDGAFIGGHISIDDQLRIFANAGFNMIRFSQDNGGIPRLATNTSGAEGYDIYDETAALYHDWLMQKIRSNNFRIYCGLFGFETTIEGPSPSPERLAFVKYVVDRWAAYVDVWEIFNEEYAPNDQWLVTIANEIRARDPYNHLITTSYDNVARYIPEIEISSPHVYTSENQLISDQYVANLATSYHKWNKPIIFGEWGNSNYNWLADSALRMRIRNWTAFFKEVSMIFWETSWATNGNSGSAANIYLGFKERQYNHILMWFVNQVLKSNSVEASVTVSNPNLIRAYSLSSSDGFASYIHHFVDHSNTISGQTISFTSPQAGQGYWIDPKTGTLLGTVSVNSGSNILPIPNFIVDIAFFSTASSLDTKPIAHVIINNPQADGDLDDDGKTDYGPTIMAFGKPPLTLNFDASNSYDLDGGTVSFSWDFGDGITGSGAIVNHTYPDGIFLTTLTVTDNKANIAKHSFMVRATADQNPGQNNTPTLRLSPSSVTVHEGEPIIITIGGHDRELNGSQYTDDTLTHIASNLPTGASFGTWGANWSKQFYWLPDFDQAGSYSVQFSVQDDSGASTSPQTVNITVLDAIDTNTHTISASAGIGGTISPSGSVSVNTGTNQSFTITAYNGYLIEDILIDGSSVGVQTSYTFPNVTSDHTIEVYFTSTSIPTHTITAYAGSGGTISPSGTITVNQGASQTFSIIANPGYDIANVIVDNVSLGVKTSYTFPNVTSDHTIEVYFTSTSIPTHTITATSGSSGTISPSGTIIVNQGASRTFTITANTGYDISNVLVDGSSVGVRTSYTFNNVTANHTIEALFAIKTYSLTVNATNGTVSQSPDKPTYNHGEIVTLQATAYNKYYFTNWSGALSGSTNPKTIYMDSDKTVMANFTYDGANPSTNGHIPQKQSYQAPRDTIIQLHITDSGSGVKHDGGTVTIDIEGDRIYEGANEYPAGVYDSRGKSQVVKGICRRAGTESDYTFIFQPSTLFDYEQKVDVVVNATDNAGNKLTENYYFYTTMRTFGKNVKVNSDTGSLAQNNPATATDSKGNIWIVWDQTTTAGDTDIYIGKLPANGSTFESSASVITNPNDQLNPSIAIDSGNKIYVVWQDNRQASDNNQGEWDIYLSTSTDGKNWSTETRVNDPQKNNQFNPAIVIDRQSPNRAYVVWQDDNAGHHDIYLATSSNGFTTKTVSKPITTNTSNQTEPDIAVNSANTVYVVWTDGRNSSSDIYGAASNNNWNNIPFVNNSMNQTSPVIETESSGTILHILWIENTTSNKHIYYSTSNGLPSSSLTVNSISDEANSNQSSPSISVYGKKVFACWQDARNVLNNNADTDIYYAEKTGSDFGTNILVNDDVGTYRQTSPVIGIDIKGNPYMVWVDERQGNKDIYYAGAMSISPDLVTKDINANTGGTMEDVGSGTQVEIPAGALSVNATISIAEILNPPELPSGTIGGPYEFGPSGLEFSQPVTLTIPCAASDCLGYSVYNVYWYNEKSGTWSKYGISNIQHIVLSPTLHAVKFQTTHFTSFGISGSVGGGSVGGGSVGGGGGGGGGCSISTGGECDIVEYILPYIGFFLVISILSIRDARIRKIRNKIGGEC